MCSSHSISTPEASMMRTTAAATSGPMPSPGISVIRCFISKKSVDSSQQSLVNLMAAQSHQVPEDAEIIIIGGGVIGLSIARALALRGVDDVAVIERGEFGREASWAAGGILAPQIEADAADDFLRLACASRDLYPAFAAALLQETAIDIELD